MLQLFLLAKLPWQRQVLSIVHTLEAALMRDARQNSLDIDIQQLTVTTRPGHKHTTAQNNVSLIILPGALAISIILEGDAC